MIDEMTDQDPPQTLPGDFFDKPGMASTTAAPAGAPPATLPGDFFDKLDQQKQAEEKKKPPAPTTPYGRFQQEHPVLSAPLDLLEGIGSGVFSTARGLNQLVSKGAQYLPGSPNIPVVVPESLTKAPDSIAGQIGHYGEQAAEFLLPAGKIGEAGKALEAMMGASRTGKAVALAGKAGLEAIPAYGITLAQTGGDTDAARHAAYMAAGTTVALPLIGQAYRQMTGATTGAGEYVVGRAMDKPTPELLAAMRGEITEADVLANTRQAVENVAKKRSADYVARLNQLNLNTHINLRSTLQTMDHMLGQFGVQQVANPQTGKMELDFARSHLMLDGAAQQKVRGIYDTLVGFQWRDALSIDHLKRAIDGEYAGSGKASAFVQAVKDELRNTLDKAVPGYQNMTREYAEASDFLDNLTELSTGNKNDGVAIRKLAGALKQNNNYRKDLLEALDAYTSKDLVGQIAGSRLSSYSPRGIMGALTAAGGIEHFFQNPVTHFLSGSVLLGLFGMSPRAVGEAAAKAGAFSRLTKAVGSYLPSALGGDQQPDRGKSALDQNYAAPQQQPNYGKSVLDRYAYGGEVDDDNSDEADSGSDDSVLQSITRRILGTQDDLSYGDKYLRPVAASRITQTPIWQMDTEYHQWPEGKLGEYEPIFDRINVRPETLQNNPNEVVPHESGHALYENAVLDPGLVLRHNAPPEVLRQILSLPGVYPPLPDKANRAQIQVNRNMNANERLAYSIGLPGATPFIEKVANSILDPKVAERLRRLHYNALITRSYTRGRASQVPDAHATGGKIGYDDGGDVEDDSDEVLREIERRRLAGKNGMIQLGAQPGQFYQQPITINPERSKQNLFGDYYDPSKTPPPPAAPTPALPWEMQLQQPRGGKGDIAGGILDATTGGVGQFARGLEQFSEPTGTLKEGAAAGHDIVAGTMGMATPFLMGSGLESPTALAKTVRTLGGAGVVQNIVQDELRSRDVAPEYVSAAGDIAGIVAGSAIHGTFSGKPTPAGKIVPAEDAAALSRAQLGMGEPGEAAAAQSRQIQSIQTPAITELLQRVEEPGVGRASFDKPHGIYTSPAGVESPHADLGGDTFYWKKNPAAAVLRIPETRDPDVWIRQGARSAGAGVWALRDLAGPEDFAAMKAMSRDALNQLASNRFPDVDWTRYYDKQEVMEGLGGMMAKEKGYHAIELVGRSPQDTEYVGLTPESMTPVNATQTAPLGQKLQQGLQNFWQNEQGSSPVPLAAHVLADYSIAGARKIIGGAQRFSDWSRGMLDDFGQQIQPHLRAIWGEAQHIAGAIGWGAESNQEMPLGNRLTVHAGPVAPDAPVIAQNAVPHLVQRNLDNLNVFHQRNPTMFASNENYIRGMNELFRPRSGRVPIPPDNLIAYSNNTPALGASIDEVSPGQRTLAEEGLQAAGRVRQAYGANSMSPVHTGLYFGWGALSPRQSPYPQESGFLHALDAGLEQWVGMAARGQFDEATLPAYLEWSAQTLRGTPGAQATSNLNSFGRQFLINAGKPVENGPYRGMRTIDALHQIIGDQNLSTIEARRRYQQINNGLGIDNKVFSFIMLVTGHPDTLVADRVRINDFWDAPKLEQQGLSYTTNEQGMMETTRNLYDNGLNQAWNGITGLGMYEAAERSLADRVRQEYANRGINDGTLGRWHWETWLAKSGQEVSHGSLGAIAKMGGQGLTGQQAVVGEGVRQGKYNDLSYGVRYERAPQGFRYNWQKSNGDVVSLTPEQHTQMLQSLREMRDKKQVSGYTEKERIIPYGTKTSESATGPWHDLPGINRSALDRLLDRLSSR